MSPLPCLIFMVKRNYLKQTSAKTTVVFFMLRTYFKGKTLSYVLWSLSWCYNSGIERLVVQWLVASFSFYHGGSVLSCLFLLVPAFPPGALCLLPYRLSSQTPKADLWGLAALFIANALCISANIFNSLLLTQIHSAVLDIQGPGRATLFFLSLFLTPFPSSTALVPTERIWSWA